MFIAAGTRLGVYEIPSLIGRGGMGEVYRAHGAKLGGDVAIEVLPQALRDDPERLARFEREARTLAVLSHPNIAHAHGFEDSTGVPALVIELVEGPTLADRVANAPVPLDEALPIAKQIAEGLEAAHEQGIIHRDLKPANINGAARNPFRSRDGKELYYSQGAGATFSVVSVRAAPTFIGNATSVPRPGVVGTTPGLARNYDIAPDGKHFAVVVD